MSTATSTLVSLSAQLMSKTLISLADAAKEFPPRNGKHVNTATVWRWKSVGTRDADGGVVKLGAIRIGSRWWCSKQAVKRFIDAQNKEGVSGRTAIPQPVRDAHQDAVERDLTKKLGV